MNRRVIASIMVVALVAGLFSPLAPAPLAPQPVRAAPSNWCVAGDFNGWNNTSTPLYDDGTNGDLIADDGVFSLEFTIATANRYEWKILECGNWGNAYPSENAWLHTSNPNQTVTFTFDTNDHSADAGWNLLPATNIINVQGDTLPASFTAVGSFQGWNNADPNTVMQYIGNDIYWLTYTVASAGSYIGKVTATGSWDAFGADGRNKDATNLSFTTTSADEEVVFLLDARSGRVLIANQGSATGNWCVAGSFNGWNNASNPLFDDGTNGDLLGGDGIFTLDYEIATADRYEWKVFECGTWIGLPSNNAWFNTTEDDQIVKFTFDTNDHSGDTGIMLYPTQNIINVWDSLPTNFTAVGDFQGWDPDDPNTELNSVGGGIYHLDYAVASSGDHIGKITTTGSWDAFSTDGRNINAPNFDFNVPVSGGLVTFLLDAYTGRMTIQSAPPPPSAGHDNDIWWSHLGHNSRDPLYRTPGGAVETGTPVTLRMRAASGDLTAARVRVWNDRINVQMMLDMSLVADDGEYEWWEATVPASTEPTIFWYRFIAIDGTATAYYEDDAARLGGWGQTFAEAQDYSWQISVYHPDFYTPDWVRNAVIYQIFPDRFRDGDPTNNPEAGEFFYEETPTVYRSNNPDEHWNTPICDPRDAGGDCPGVWSQNFYGGDLLGIIDQLDYLQDLGVTALYLNPIFESPSNHKYDTTDFSIIDDNFGDLTTFISLTTALQSRGMHLILDGVFNHVSSDSIYFDRYGRYDSVGACESIASPYRDWFYFIPADPPGSGPCVGDDGTPGGADYESWWGYDSLPKMRATIQEARELIWDGAVDPQTREPIAVYWLQQGADGWRLDVAADVDPGVTNEDPANPNDYWEGFRAALRAENSEAYIVGEEWGNSTPWLVEPEWDASMNYQFSTALLGFWRDTVYTDNDYNTGSSAGPVAPLTPSQLEERLRYLEERYPPQAYYAMMNLLGSHDTNRPLFVLDHNAHLNDRSIYENPDYDWSDAITRLKGVALLQFTLPGAPTVYYGDEIGLVAPPTYAGGKWEDDPYNRIPYPWLDETGTPFYTHLQGGGYGQTTLRDYYELLATTRNAHPALRTGTFDTLLIDDANMVYAYGRRMDDFSDAAVVVANRHTDVQTVTLDVGGYLPVGTSLVDVLNGDAAYTVAAGGVLEIVDVPGMSGALLVLSGTLELPPDAVVDLAVTGEDDGEVTLAWIAASGADSYNLYRSLVSGGGYEFITTTTSLAYTDTGLQNAVTYYYVLVSKDDTTLLESGYSNEASGMPHINIGWAELSGPASIVHTIGITPTEIITGQVWIDGVTGSGAETPGLWAQVGYGPTATHPYSWTLWINAPFSHDLGNNDVFAGALVPEETGTFHYVYRYSTTAGRDWVYADLNGIFTDTLSAPGELTVNLAADTTPPEIPLNLHVTDWGVGHIALAWDPVADSDLYAYDLYRYGEGELPGDAVQVGRVLQPATAYTDTSVTTGQTYTYTVRAVDIFFNKSGHSNEASATAEAKQVEVRFIATTPAFTPDDATVYIAGNSSAAFGSQWNPSAAPLTQIDTHTWVYTATIADGEPLEYKYTRGDWERVENWGDLAGFTNRELVIDYGTTGVMTVTDTVFNWRDALVVATYPVQDALTWDPSGPISVTFNRPIDPDAVDATTFSVTHYFTSESVSGTFSFDSAVIGPYDHPTLGSGTITGTMVLFTPDQPLDQAYQVYLVKEGYNASTDDGSQMRRDYWWDFGADKTYTLTVELVGQGMVAAIPGGPYAYNEVITLTATPGAHWTFAHWSGDLIGSDPTTVFTITGNAHITATFTQLEYALDVIVDPAGSGTVDVTPAGPYHYGDTITLTAEANPGWVFTSWSGDLGGDPTTVFTITGNAHITATFTQLEYALDVIVDPAGSGTVDVDPAGPYHYGDTITLTAEANPGWVFATWSGDLTGAGDTRVFTITHDMLVTATFTQDCIPVAGVDFTWSPLMPLGGDLVTFNATVLTGATPLTYTWNFGAGAIPGASEITHTFPMTNTEVTYNVTLTVFNPCTPEGVEVTQQLTVRPRYIFLPLVSRTYTP